MLTPTEREEIRQLIEQELADIEDQCARAGSFNYLCRISGVGRVLTHRPQGRVLRPIAHSCHWEPIEDDDTED